MYVIYIYVDLSVLLFVGECMGGITTWTRTSAVGERDSGHSASGTLLRPRWLWYHSSNGLCE